MKKLVLVVVLLIGMLIIVNSAIGQNYIVNDAVGICDDFITELFPGSIIGPSCNATDIGNTWFVVWNLACPFILNDPSTGPRRTGAACEVNKTTGKIVFLAVSARVIIK